ncbi:MAG: hypothetical protein A2Y61_05730 [Chloroflexi bacterium RBG_13_60_13]|nr:MAG: hypothetical protein A2Y61_05730 [Chloroflexi bacterium RBG_13_60_13]
MASRRPLIASFPPFAAVQRVSTPLVMAAENPLRPIGMAVAPYGLKIVGDTLYVGDCFAFGLPV